MKKYIAIAALAVASILIAFAVLPGLSADNTTTQSTTATAEQIKYDREFAGAQSAEIRSHINTTPALGQPVDRPALFLNDEGTNGVYVTTVVTNSNGKPVRRSSKLGFPRPENPKDYQPGMVNMVTPISQNDRPFMVFVLTSTDLTNWYPVSYGQTFPESKQPRYFKMWTGSDETLQNIDALIERTSGETRERLKKLKQDVEGSK